MNIIRRKLQTEEKTKQDSKEYSCEQQAQRNDHFKSYNE
jgi:hypothetical protein